MSSTNELATQTATKKAPKKSRPSASKGSVTGNPQKGILPFKVAKLATKAEKIRALWMTSKWTRLQIARALGISFQHVYNTTHRPTKDFNPDKFSGPKSR